MPHPKLTELRAFLLNKLGLHFKACQGKELYDKLKTASKNFGFDDTDKFILWLLNQPLNSDQTEKLATYLTIGETYFFREKKALDYLEFKYLPELIKKRKGKNQYLKIWSAGCASGEEPYSIAILLKRVIPDIKNWDITILATDINAAFLDRARKGVYTEWSFRSIPESFKTTHFKKTSKNKYKINHAIQKMVTFSYLNLAADPYPSLVNGTNAVDIILCRNVLIYFSHDGIKAVTTNFYNSLIDGGVLLVSPVETSSLISSKFSTFSYNRITIYNKDIENALKHKKINSEPVKLPDKPKLNIPLKNSLHKYKKTKTHIHKTAKIKVPEKTAHKKKTVDHSDYKEAMAHYESGSFDKVEQLVNNAIKTKKGDLKPYIMLLARIKANKGLLDESKELCLRAISLDKVDAKAHYLLATVIYEQGKTKEAIHSLKKTLFLNHDFVPGHFLLGNISLNDGKKSESKKHFSNALKSLAKLNHSDVIAESDGLTAGRFTEIIHSMTI